MVRICFKWFVKFFKTWRRCALAADQIPLLTVTFDQVVYCFPLRQMIIKASSKHNICTKPRTVRDEKIDRLRIMTHQINSTSKNDAMQDTRLTLDMVLSLIRLHVEGAGLEKYKTARSQSCRHGKANQCSSDDTWPRALGYDINYQTTVNALLYTSMLTCQWICYRQTAATIKNLGINLQVRIPILASHRLEILNMSIYQGFSSHLSRYSGKRGIKQGPIVQTLCA